MVVRENGLVRSRRRHGHQTRQDLQDRAARQIDALVLIAKRELRGERRVMRGDPQRQLAAPVG